MSVWQYIWRLVTFQPKLYLLHGLLTILIFVSFQAEGWIIQGFFDALSKDTQVDDTTWTLIALLVVLTIARATVIFSNMAVNVIWRFNAGTLLRRNLFETCFTRPDMVTESVASGEMVSRFRDDVDAIVNFLASLLDLIGLFVFAAIAAVILIKIDPVITAVVFLPLIGVAAVANLASRRISSFHQASRAATEQVTGLIAEIFGAAETLKMANAEENIAEHFRVLSERRRKVSLQERWYTELLQSIWWNTVNVGTGVILLLIGQAIRVGTFTVGDFALFVYYLGWVTELPRTLGVFLTHYQQVGVSFERLGTLLPNAPPENLTGHHPVYLKGPLPDPSYIANGGIQRLSELNTVNLTYHYPGTQRGIDNINLHLKRGTITVITGRIGAGKTTLLRVLLGLLPKNTGEIFWNGASIAEPATFFIPPRSAYTPQAPHLFDESLRNNILLGVPETVVDLTSALYAAVMEQDVPSLKQGLDTLVGPRGAKLSGGQLQRAAAARMFVREPDLLVFDDLSSALDVETERTLWERLVARRRRAERDMPTCLAVSHRRVALRYSDRIIVLKEGGIEAEGTLDELLQSSAEMQRIWHGDLGKRAA